MPQKDQIAKAAYDAKWYRLNRARKAASGKLFESRHRFVRALQWSCRAAKKYGFEPCSATIEQVTAAFTGRCQNTACDISESECSKRLCLDHDHATGQFRGWLCFRCNSAAGLLDESREKVGGLADYLLPKI